MRGSLRARMDEVRAAVDHGWSAYAGKPDIDTGAPWRQHSRQIQTATTHDPAAAGGPGRSGSVPLTEPVALTAIAGRVARACPPEPAQQLLRA